MLISIFDTPKLSLTVMRSVMLITPIWLEIVDPGAKTFLNNDPETFTSCERVFFISDQILKISIRVTDVVNFTSIETVPSASLRFRLVSVRISNQNSFCVIIIVPRGSLISP